MSKITYVNLADLFLPEFQAHRNTKQELIRELADSIRDIGIIEPLIIRKTKKGLEIVAGCLRYQAALLAGLKAAPCISMSLDPKSAEILKLHENIKRISLDHVDQGHTFIMMMESFSMTEKEISKAVGRSIGYVSQHISLVRLNNELTRAVESGSISFSQARELMRVTNQEDRTRFLKYCQDDGATVRILQQWVHDSLRENTPIPEIPPDIQEQNYSDSESKILRSCEACSKPVEIGHIRQLLLCPHCFSAIKKAISEEIAQNST